MTVNQKDVLAWRRQAFVHQPDVIIQAAKVAEEAGEVLGAVVKRHQGVKQHIDWTDEIKKEMADLYFAMLTVAELEGWDFNENATAQWSVIKQKDFR